MAFPSHRGGGGGIQPRSKRLPCYHCSMSLNRIIIMASTNDFNLRCPLVLALSPPHWPSCGVAFFHFNSFRQSQALGTSGSTSPGCRENLSPHFFTISTAGSCFANVIVAGHLRCLLHPFIRCSSVLFRLVLFSALFRLSSRLFEVMLNVSLLSLCKSFYTNEICAKWR